VPRVLAAPFLLFVAVMPARAEIPLPPVKPFELRVHQHNVPLPPMRPPRPGEETAISPQEPAEPVDAETAPAGPPPPSACRLALAEKAAFVALPPITGPGECGAADAVRLEGLVLADWSRVTFNPPAVLRCEMATALVDWMRDDVAATAATLGGRLATIENYDSFDCRGRNRVVGAKISEHGKGNAIDIRAFRLVDGRRFEWTDVTVVKSLRERLKAGACARFSTVLGPGSDGYHEEHVHVDIAERRGNHRMCQWNVLDAADMVPLPRPRPAEAPPREAAAPEEAPEPE
jgi:hypothetical protein